MVTITSSRLPLGQAIKGRLRRRVLIVNCYFDDLGQAIGRTKKVPQAIGPAYLAGGFSREHCDLRVYNEQYSGPIQDADLLDWPDMLVLTGLASAFDRMLHVTAYARTKNPGIIVVAGGPAVRALPHFAARFFDYACAGDIEQIQEVIADSFGRAYVAEEMLPRFDLVYWTRDLGYLESSRNCNFRCTFCSMTAEGNKYRIYDMDYIRRQILMIGKRKLVFVDNNFYGNDREFFLQRMAMLQELRRAGQFDGWAALVTSDFFLKDENLSLARNAGCEVLFSGVESFDVETLSKFRKYQNTRTPQTALIRKCLSAGILFVYGLILDVTTRPIDDLLAEIEFILGTPDLTLPSYLSVPIPLLRTPFFYECLEKGLLLSNTRLRDLNSTTIAIQTLDPIDRAAAFVRDMQSLRGYRRRTIRHSLGFFRRYRRRLSARQMGIALAQVPLLCAYSLATAPMQWSLGRRSANRTHISSTEPLDPMYTPTLPVAARFADHFQPTVVIDEDGAVAGPLREDLLSHRQITVE